ncbi:MAG TPA: acyltransferase, partial [Acidimicrobiales bacterium]|nr:acyltransferase [Acidimicrobiales bacterium]
VASHVYLLNPVNYLGNRHLKVLFWAQGATGVWLFFVLSGFVISRPFVSGLIRGELPNVRHYAMHRVFRIFPLFWLSLLVISVTTHAWTLATWKARLSNLFLAINLVPGQQNGTIISVWWTLSIEACFYVFLPVVAWLVLRWRSGGVTPRQLAAGVVVVWILSVAWAVVASTVHQTQTGLWLRQVFPAVLASFCPGILLAVSEHGELLPHAWQVRAEAFLRRAVFVLPVALAVLIAGAYGTTAIYHIPLATFSIQFYAVGYGLVVAWALRLKVPDRPWVRVWAWLGLISYGIYIWHAIVLKIMQDHRAGLPLTAHWITKPIYSIPVASHPGLPDDLLRLAWILLLTVAAAALSWYLVESHLNRWAHHSSKREAAIATGHV